jgi:hypothetical protein
LLAYELWLAAGVFGLAILYAIGPRAVELASRIQTHPKLLKRVVELQERVADLESANDGLVETAKLQYAAGFRVAADHARGAVLAGLSGAAPTLEAITMKEGRLVVIGRYQDEPPPLGARYALRDTYVEEPKGVVEVTTIDEERNLVFMACTHEFEANYWRQLENRAPVDSTPPPSTVIVLAQLDYGSAMQLTESDTTSLLPSGGSDAG